MKLRLFIDGASRGNPGPAGLGVVVTDAHQRVVAELGEYLGETTNNVAEYRALLRGLQEAHDRGATEIEVFADSDLLVRQIGGSYRVKSPHLAALHTEAIGLLRGFPKWRIAHVPRGRNAAADALANGAIDAVAPSRSVDLTALVARDGAKWRAWIPALPGCEAVASTQTDALTRVEEVARDRLAGDRVAASALPKEHRIRITLSEEPR
jgi:ribonuclease HI